MVLLLADGPDFCAGADLEQTIRNATTHGPIENLADAARLGALFVALRRLGPVEVSELTGRQETIEFRLPPELTDGTSAGRRATAKV